jgi:hypothetical protein
LGLIASRDGPPAMGTCACGVNPPVALSMVNTDIWFASCAATYT